MKIIGYMGFHPTEAPNGEFATTSLTDADKAAGWSEKPVAVVDDVLEFAASICEQSTSWGLSPTKLEVAQSMQKHCAKAIRAQKSDSPERAKAEANYVTVTEGGSGHYAVLVDGKNGEPIQTGSGRYATAEEAAGEAKDWATAEGLEFRP